MDPRVKTFMELGTNAANNGQYDMAIEYFNEALAIDKNNHQVLLKKAEAQRKNGDIISAMGTADLLLSIDMNNRAVLKFRENCLNEIRNIPNTPSSSDNDNSVAAAGQEPNIEFDDLPSFSLIDDEIFFELEDENGDVVELASDSSTHSEILAIPKDISKDQSESYDDLTDDEIRGKALDKSEELINVLKEEKKRKNLNLDINVRPGEIARMIQEGDHKKALQLAESYLSKIYYYRELHNWAHRLSKRVKHNIRELKSQGIEMNDSKTFSLEINKMLAEGEYEMVARKCSEYLDKLIYRKVLYQEALKSIKQGWNKVKECEGNGIAEKGAEDLLSRARVFLIKGKYLESKEKSEECAELLQEKIRHVGEIEKRIDEIGKKLLFFKSKGMKLDDEIDELNKLHRALKDFSKKKELANGFDEIGQIQNSLEEKVREIEDKYNQGSILIARAELLVKDIDRKRSDTNIEGLIQLMHNRLTKGMIEEMHELLGELEKSYEEQKEQFERNNALSEIEGLEEIYNECLEFGIDVVQRSNQLKEVKSLFNSCEYQPSLELSRKVCHELSRKKLQFLLKDTREMVENSLDDESDLTISSYSSAKEDLDMVEDILEEKRLKDAERELFIIRHPLFKERAENALAGAVKKIKDIQERMDDEPGEEIFTAKELLAQAQKAFEDGFFESSYDTALSSIDTAEKSESYMEVMYELIKTKEKLQEFKKKGVDIAEASRIFQRAKPALDNGYYQAALDHTDRSIKEAERSQSSMRFTNKVSNIEERLSEVREGNIDIDSILNDLGKIKIFLAKDEFEELEDLLFDVEGQLSIKEDKLEKRNKKKAIRFKKKGNQLYKNGDFKESVKYYERALKLYSKDEKIYQNLGLAYKNLGDVGKAMECADNALEIKADYEPAMKLKRKCREMF